MNSEKEESFPQNKSLPIVNGGRKPFRFNWKSLAFLLIAGIVIFTIVPKLVGLKDAVMLLDRMNIGWLVVALLLEFVFYFGVAVLLYIILLVIEKRFRFWDLIKISYLSNFALHAFPVGFIGPGIVNYYFLKLQGLTDGETILTIVMRNVFTYIALGLLLIISIIYLPTKAGLSQTQLYIVSALTLFAILLLVYIVYLYFNKEKFFKRSIQLVNFVNKVSKFIRKKEVLNEDQTKKMVEEIYQGLALFDKKREAIPYAILGGLVNWLGDIICLFFVFLAFGYHVHAGVVIFAYVIATILSIASFVPAGLGVIEGSLSLIIVGFGAPADITLMSVLVFRLISFWLTIPVGMFSFYSLLREAKLKKVQAQDYQNKQNEG